MIVKDIRFLREFFKSNVCESKDENRNPHFAGYSRKIKDGNEYGYFDLYHGLKPDMENLLKTILEMARDSQAVYEFMQNAVDAESSDFALFPYKVEKSNQHYLVVINNGKPFNLKGVLAILNIGSGTKFRDADTIGQFGVGFKLAHRLVGEETGLYELMKENKGPILFSWAKNEIDKLAAGEPIEPSDNGFEGIGEEVVTTGTAPWLFKILYTNFPCLPDESIIDANGEGITNAFTEEEYKTLIEVAKICKATIYNDVEYKEGTLLLIPLHQKKVKELSEESERDGLEYSTAILNNRSGKHKTLERIVLNGNILKTAKPIIESFRLSKDLLLGEDGKKDQQFFEKIESLELDFCYYDPFEITENPFTGKPQFYLFFPMSEERHGFWFALHCNAFAFSSSRTALQENTARNKTIFLVFIKELLGRLNNYVRLHDAHFLKIFAILTLSKRGEDDKWKENRLWLEEEFWNPMMSELTHLLPIRDPKHGWNIAPNNIPLYIKNSTLPIEEWIDENCVWFYWSYLEHTELCKSAIAKFSIDEKSFFDVLQNDLSIQKINKWLQSPEGNSKAVLSSVQDSLLKIGVLDKKVQDKIWDRIKQLQIWSFNGTKKSIKELSDEGNKTLLINYGPLVELSEIVEKSGIVLSSENLDEFPELIEKLRSRVQSELPYLLDFKELNLLLSSRFSLANVFSFEEKQKIFGVVSKAVTANSKDVLSRIARMKVLALFCNKKGDVRSLEELIGVKEVPKLLSDWFIDIEDASQLDLSEYTSNSKEEIYENVIIKFWNEIIAQEGSDADWRNLFDFIVECFKLKPTMQVLPSTSIKFGLSGFVSGNDKFFYHEKLIELNDESFRLLTEAAHLTGLGIIPKKHLIPYYKSKPFELSSVVTPELSLDKDGGELSEEQAIVLAQFCSAISSSFFDNYLFTQSDEKIKIVDRPENTLSFYSNDSNLSSFIGKHFKNLLPLPPSFKYLSNSSLKDSSLLTKLLEATPITDQEILHELAVIVHDKGEESHIQDLLKKVQRFPISTPIEKGSFIGSLLKLCFVKDDYILCQKLVEELVLVTDGEVSKPLSEIKNRGSDKLIVAGKGEKQLTFSISTLLGGKESEINKQITEAAIKWMNAGIATPDKIETVLKLTQPPTKETVFGELKGLLKRDYGSVVQNGEQLMFILLITSVDKKALDELSVETLGDNLELKSNTFYVDEAIKDFIPLSNILSPRYNCSLLADELASQKIIEVSECTILGSPFLQHGDLIMPGVEELFSAESKEAFLKFLLNIWNRLGDKKRISWNVGNNNWNRLIGFNPHKWVIAEKYALDEELIPDIAYTVANLSKDDFQGFALALGAHNEQSDLILWRKYFLKEVKEKPSGALSVKQTVRTLRWLSEKEISVINQDLVTLYNTLEKKIGIKELPLPIFLAGFKDYKIGLPNKEYRVLTKEIEEGLTKRDIKIAYLLNTLQIPIIPLIGSTSSFWSSIQSEYEKLDVEWSKILWETLSHESEEWNGEFYLEWKKRHLGHTIFKTKTSIPLVTTVNGKTLLNFREGDIVKDPSQNRVYINGELTIISALEKLEKTEGVLDAAQINDLKALYTSHSSLMQQTLERALQDKNIGEEIKRLIEQASNRQEREERASRLMGHPDYTLQWFLDLLEFVKAQEKVNNVPEIEFSSIRALFDQNNIYELGQPSNQVPSNIETFDVINAQINYRDVSNRITNIQTTIEVSLKHQKLWARFPGSNAQPVLSNLKNIISVRLKFSRTVDLIEQLKLGYQSLGYVPSYSLKENLSRNIHFLFGPPGTGKTTEVAKRLLSQMTGEIEGPIVVLTPTNKAADVLANKIIEQNNGNAPFWLKRFGTCTDPDLQDAQVVVKEPIVVNRATQVVLITTIHRFAYDRVLINITTTDKSRLCDVPWSLVVFDEASMIPIAYAAFAIHVRQMQSPATKFLIAGDPLQIPPVFDLVSEDLDNAYELQKENIYTMVGLMTFDKTEQAKIKVYGENNQIENLETQHRSIPVIGELFSQFQYGGKIAHSRGTNKNKKSGSPSILPPFFHALGFKPITIVRYRVQPGDTIYNPRQLNNSPLHLQSALLATEVVKKFYDELQLFESEPWTVGIISPYRSQASLIDKLVEARIPFSPKLQINIDTVHGFQGDENKLIIAVLNPGNANVFYSRFLKEKHILNVAISRAEDYLILFVPDEQSDGLSSLNLIHGSHYGSLLEIINRLPAELTKEITAQELELALLDNKFYFENNSFTTAHLPVNVYGEARIDYMFRLSGSAVDVHWRSLQ